MLSRQPSQSARLTWPPHPTVVPFWLQPCWGNADGKEPQHGRANVVKFPLGFWSPCSLGLTLTIHEPALAWPSGGVTQRMWASIPHARAGRSGLTQPRTASLTPEGRARSPSLLKQTGHPSLKISAMLKHCFGAPCHPLSWFSNLAFSSVLRTTVYCKPIHNHFTLFINQIKANKRKHKKIFLYLCITSSWEPTKAPQRQAWFSSKAQSGPFCNAHCA